MDRRNSDDNDGRNPFRGEKIEGTFRRKGVGRLISDPGDFGRNNESAA